MVVWRRIWQMHPLDVDDPAVRLKFQIFASQVESPAFAIRPLVTDFAARFRLVDADGHRPTFRTEQPFLDYFRIGVGAINGFRRRSEVPGHDHVFIPFSLQRQLAHRFSPLFIFGCSMPARTSSSWS